RHTTTTPVITTFPPVRLRTRRGCRICHGPWPPPLKLSAPSRRSACRTKRDRFRPRYHILGSDIAGRVEVVGRHATLFRPGEDAFGDILRQMGGFAQYVCVPQGVLAPLPAGMSYEQAARAGRRRSGVRPPATNPAGRHSARLSAAST